MDTNGNELTPKGASQHQKERTEAKGSELAHRDRVDKKGTEYTHGGKFTEGERVDTKRARGPKQSELDHRE